MPPRLMELEVGPGALDADAGNNAKRPKRQHLTFQRISEELGQSGYQGGYNTVRR